MEYANLGIRSLRLHEIRRTQFDAALALEPDLLSITGGINDVIGPHPDFGRLAADYDAMFGAATDRGITVISFLMPDPTFLNPLGRYARARMIILNDLVRAAAKNTGALLLDLSDCPVASDPRLWYEDGLHGNWLGHTRMAQGFADLLGFSGFEHWSDPLPGPPGEQRTLARIGGTVDWAVHWLGPWLARGIARVPHGYGVQPKRPEPTPVEAATTA